MGKPIVILESVSDLMPRADKIAVIIGGVSAATLNRLNEWFALIVAALTIILLLLRIFKVVREMRSGEESDGED